MIRHVFSRNLFSLITIDSDGDYNFIGSVSLVEKNNIEWLR